MSCTFACPEAGVREVPCEWCVRYKAESPEDLVEGKCDRYCLGFQTEHNSPAVNFSNHNTAALLRMLAIPSEDYGQIPANEVHAVLRRVIRALNLEQARISALETSTENLGVLGARVISLGTTDEDTIQRLTALQNLLVYAADHGYSIMWD